MNYFVINGAFLALSTTFLTASALSGGIPARNHNGRKGFALVDTTDGQGGFIQCGGALLSEYHVLTSRMCCDKKSEPAVILGTRIPYGELGERFRTAKHCLLQEPFRDESAFLQTCLLTLTRPVLFRDTIAPYHLPINKSISQLFVFAMGPPTSDKWELPKELNVLSLAATDLQECQVDSQVPVCVHGISSGCLTQTDIGSPITMGVDMELYGLAATWVVPTVNPTPSLVIPIRQYRSILLGMMSGAISKCYNKD